MGFNYNHILSGLQIVPKAATTSVALGDFEVLTSTNKAYFHNGTTNSPVVTEDHTATLTNKTIDGDDNTFLNIPGSAITGVVDTANGGTGLSSPGAVGNVLTSNGTIWTSAPPASGSGTVTSVDMTVPTFLSVSGNPITTSGTLAVTLSGTALPVANGGTSLTTLTLNNVILGNGTSAPTFVAPGAVRNILQSDGTTWTSVVGGNWSNATENFQTGTTYTYALSDIGKLVSFDNSSPVTVTVPDNASVAFPIGSVIHSIQIGTGAVTIDPDTGVTVDSLGGELTFAGQFAEVTLIKTGTDSWYLFGGGIMSASDCCPLITSATGGTITTVGDYKIHDFTSSDTFTIVSGGGYIDSIVVIAGGGGGGADATSNVGGGGGGGGLVYQNPSSNTYIQGSYTVTIGAGGSGGPGATNGSNSSFGTVVAIGGGAGANSPTTATSAADGGSGGGGTVTLTAGGTGYTGQGYDGGDGFGSLGVNQAGGGGGGAGGTGFTAAADVGGDGGPGFPVIISGSEVYYAGGGGGSATLGSPVQGVGGVGGGGTANTPTGDAGTANTGGGGGAGYSGSSSGGAGGSGRVIIRYKFQ